MKKSMCNGMYANCKKVVYVEKTRGTKNTGGAVISTSKLKIGLMKNLTWVLPILFFIRA